MQAQTAAATSASPAPSPGEPFFSGKRLERFEALQARLVPRAAEFTPQERERSRALVNALVAKQAEKNRRKLGLFLAIIDIISFFFGFAPFRKLAPQAQDRVLNWLFNAPISLLRKGFWGINTISRLGVYGQTELYEEIGYEVRPNPEDSK